VVWFGRVRLGDCPPTIHYLLKLTLSYNIERNIFFCPYDTESFYKLSGRPALPLSNEFFANLGNVSIDRKNRTKFLK
jgi:hypothetical protein